MASPRLDTFASQQEAQAAELVFQAAAGYMVTAALYTVTRLNIADLLADGPRPIAALAAETHSNEDALYRVLRALASAGIFAETAPRTFALSDAAEFLRSDAPTSLKDLVCWLGNPFHFQVWSQMPHSVETGRPAVEHVYGKPCFECFADMPDVARDFNEAMTSFSAQLAPALIEAYDFSGTQVMMDVAGGHGYILSQVLNRYPRMRGILFDVKDVVEGAKPRLEAQNLSFRCQTVAGNFFESIPAGADTYYMQHIIHDWDDGKALTILLNCRKALNGRVDGKLLVVDSVLTDGSGPDPAKLIDLEMLLMPGGRERTEAEMRSLFRRAGFEITRVLPLRGSQSVIEARLA